MGCDIHCFAEVKYKEKWKFAGEIIINRRYELFAYMADVRNNGDIIPLKQPSGVPDDADDITKDILICVDYHSHSYLDLPDILKLIDFKDSWGNGPFWNELKGFLYLVVDHLNPDEDYQEEDYANITDMRIVFAFDN